MDDEQIRMTYPSTSSRIKKKLSKRWIIRNKIRIHHLRSFSRRLNTFRHSSKMEQQEKFSQLPLKITLTGIG